MLGLQFSLSQAQANYWTHHLLPVSPPALGNLGHKLERADSKVAKRQLNGARAPDLVIDGTERRQRLKNNER